MVVGQTEFSAKPPLAAPYAGVALKCSRAVMRACVAVAVGKCAQEPLRDLPGRQTTQHAHEQSWRASCVTLDLRFMDRGACIGTRTRTRTRAGATCRATLVPRLLVVHRTASVPMALDEGSRSTPQGEVRGRCCGEESACSRAPLIGPFFIGFQASNRER